jgi:hypothetical protein
MSPASIKLFADQPSNQKRVEPKSLLVNDPFGDAAFGQGCNEKISIVRDVVDCDRWSRAATIPIFRS